MRLQLFTRCFWIIVTLFVCHTTIAQTTNQRAYVLFLYSFTKYVQWPQTAVGEEFVIGVYGNDPIMGELKVLAATKKAGELPFKVIEITSDEQLGGVQLLYFPASRGDAWERLLSKVKDLPILVVCEQDGMVEKGASVSFRSVGRNMLRFELNKEAVMAHDLKVSKNLESLAYKGS